MSALAGEGELLVSGAAHVGLPCTVPYRIVQIVNVGLHGAVQVGVHGAVEDGSVRV